MGFGVERKRRLEYILLFSYQPSETVFSCPYNPRYLATVAKNLLPSRPQFVFGLKEFAFSCGDLKFEIVVLILDRA